MIILKKIDVYGQLLIITGSIVYALLETNATIIFCYFIVGGWQVLSTAIQLSITASNKPQVIDRKAYNIFLMIAILTVPIGSYWVLLFVAPFTAFWYLSISYRELKIWEFRRFIQLK